ASRNCCSPAWSCSPNATTWPPSTPDSCANPSAARPQPAPNPVGTTPTPGAGANVTPPEPNDSRAHPIAAPADRTSPSRLMPATQQTAHRADQQTPTMPGGPFCAPAPRSPASSVRPDGGYDGWLGGGPGWGGVGGPPSAAVCPPPLPGAVLGSIHPRKSGP